jgi:hypothetical protein
MSIHLFHPQLMLAVYAMSVCHPCPATDAAAIAGMHAATLAYSTELHSLVAPPIPVQHAVVGNGCKDGTGCSNSWKQAAAAATLCMFTFCIVFSQGGCIWTIHFVHAL